MGNRGFSMRRSDSGKLSQGVASMLGLSPEMAGKSWRGASLDAKMVREVLEKLGRGSEGK